MNFVTSQLKKAEALLEQVDQTAEELRTGGVLAQAREEDVEARLKSTLDAERADRERREEEFLARIKTLEAQAKAAASLERQLAQARKELEAALAERDSGELHDVADAARAEAQASRAALAATVRDTSARLAELERANVDLAMELRRQSRPAQQQQQQQLQGFMQDGAERAAEMYRAERDERVVDAESRLAAAAAALASERARGDRLEAEVGRAAAQTGELRAVLERERQARALEAQALRLDAEQARQALEQAQRGSEANGERALEQRLGSLSAHLETKQRLVDGLRSEKSALEQRLQEALMMQATRIRQAELGPARRGGARLLLRPLTSNRELERLLEGVDGFTLSLGSLLRTNPAARLGLVAYAGLLHVLLLYILAFYARRLGGGPALRGVA